MLLGVKFVTSDFKKFCVTISCHDGHIELFKVTSYNFPWGEGGGMHSGREGSAPALHILRKKGSFLRPPCPRFCKRRVLFCTKVQSMGVKIPVQSTKYMRL